MAVLMCYYYTNKINKDAWQKEREFALNDTANKNKTDSEKQ